MENMEEAMIGVIIPSNCPDNWRRFITSPHGSIRKSSIDNSHCVHMNGIICYMNKYELLGDCPIEEVGQLLGGN